jgi:hypothetical protein
MPLDVNEAHLNAVLEAGYFSLGVVEDECYLTANGRLLDSGGTSKILIGAEKATRKERNKWIKKGIDIARGIVIEEGEAAFHDYFHPEFVALHQWQCHFLFF